MSAGLINTVSHRFIIFTTFTHNVKIAASLFFGSLFGSNAAIIGSSLRASDEV